MPIVSEAPVPLLLTEIVVTEGIPEEMTGYLVKLPGISTDVAEGTPEGLQLDAVFQSVLVAPVQVLKVPDDVVTFRIPDDAAKYVALI